MKPRTTGTYFCIVSILLLLPIQAYAHGGRLDKNGCHTNRKTGEYHCHRGGPAPTRNAYVPRNNLAPSRYGGAFANCTEARAAGAAPIRRGEPGSGPHLDRDNDGVACEPYRGRR